MDDAQRYDKGKVLRSGAKDRVVGVESMTTGQEYCEGDSKQGFAGFPLEVRRCRDLESAVGALEDGTIDYVVGDAVTLRCIADDLNGVNK